MIPRVRRAERLVALRARAVDAAQAALAAAARAASEAAARADEAARAWADAVAADEAVETSASLAEAHAWRATLRRRAEAAAAQAQAARVEAEARRSDLVAARQELRKLELWRDGLAAAERATEARHARAADDETAARAAGRIP